MNLVDGACALPGVDAFAYLRESLQRIARGWPQGRLAESLPDAFAKRQPAND